MSFFGGEAVYVNHRHDNYREDLYRYCVTRFSDLRDIIVPCLEANPLRTAKRDDFAKFAGDDPSHGSASAPHGARPDLPIAEIVETKNLRKRSEVVRILRDHTPTLFAVS